VSVLVREQPYHVRCLIARARRLAASLPTVWEAFLAGDLDAEQVRIIDRVARRVAEPHTLTAIDEQVVRAAQTRTPKRLATWLLRLVVQLEPLSFEQRHRKALAERRVTVVQGADGIGYVTGEVSASDAAAIDAMLVGAARSLGAEDSRTDQQRRADLFADLLLGRLRLDEGDGDEDDSASAKDADMAVEQAAATKEGTGLATAGSKSKTSTPRLESCSAPVGSASTARTSRSARRSTLRRSRQRFRSGGWRCGNRPA
jgi:hypothetical protein